LYRLAPRINDMEVTDLLRQTGGLQFMARELGTSESQAASVSAGGGLGGLLGDLLGGHSGGGGGLASMLDMDGDGSPLDDIMRMVGKGR